eukprot:s512_g31.t1
MDQPVPPSSHGSDEAPPEGQTTTGQARPTRSGQSVASAEAHEVYDEDDGFDSEEFREWMRNRNRASRRQGRNRRRDSSEGSESRDDGGRTNAGPAPEWDGETLSFQDYAIKARLWLATTRSKPRTRGPLLLQKLSKVPFETMKFLAKDREWMKSENNGEELIDLMDKAEYFGDDRDEDLLSALAKITYHVRRERNEAHRPFFNRWETAMRKVVEHKVHLPDKYQGFLLVNALGLAESDIKSMLNYTRGSIMPVDVKDWLRKHETKLQVAQVGVDGKKSQPSASKSSGNYFMAEDESENDEDEIHAIETAINELQDGECHGDPPGGNDEDENQILDEQEAAEILNTILTKKRSFVQTQKAKKVKELGRGYKSGTMPSKGKGKTSYSATMTGKPPFKSGQYRMTIEEIKKITKCANCHRVGHWHRECPEPPRERDQHLLESEEAIFCGLLETDGSDRPSESQTVLSAIASPDSPPVGSFDVGSSEPNFQVADCQPTSPYKDRSLGKEDWEILFGEGLSNTTLVSTNPTNVNHSIPEEACATVDTGCQRMAIGYETLRQLTQHLPEELSVQLQPQEHRFRSVHGRSSTTHVAAVPTGLGKKGSLLKPAVFENEESRHAPFLISLPFLLFCRAVLYLDPQDGLRIHFKRFKFSVSCHLGPTGALRIPLCHFNQDQIRYLKQAQDDMNKIGTEFEVFRTEPEVPIPAKSGPGNHPHVSGPLVSSASHDGDREEAQPDPGQLLQDRGCLADHPLQGAVHRPGDQRFGTTSSPSTARCNGTRDVIQDVSTIQVNEHRGELRSDHIEVPDQESKVTGKLLPGKGAHHRCDSSHGGTPDSMRTWRDMSPLHLPKGGGQLPQAVLEVPITSRPTVSNLHVDDDPTLPQHEPHRGIRGGDGHRDRDLDYNTEEHDIPEELYGIPVADGSSAPLQARAHDQVGNQSLQDPSEVCHMRQDDQRGADRSGQAEGEGTRDGAQEEADGAHLRGVHGMEEVSGTRACGCVDRVPVESLDRTTETDTENTAGFRSRGVKQLLRKAGAALADAEVMWKDIITLLQEGQDQTCQQVFEQYAVEIFDPQDPQRVRNKKPLRRLAGLMGVTKKQARTVAEIFNPNRFGPHASGAGLTQGMAFDLTLGHDLLKHKTRQEVRRYIQSVKPGCVLVSSPCTMFSILQNLNQKYREDPQKEKEFIRKLVEAKVLLNFACEICQLVREYGGTFVSEQPLTSRAWSESKVQSLAQLDDTIMVRNDQCMFNLKAPEGERYKKPTGWMTNNQTVADRISRTCSRDHPHRPVFGNGPGGSRAKQAQEYPLDLVKAILEAYADTMDQDLHLRHQVHVITTEDLLNEIYRIENVLLECFNLQSHEYLATDHLEPTDAIQINAVSDENAVPDENAVSDENAMVPPEEVPEEDAAIEERPEPRGRQLPRERGLGVQQLVRRAHCGLGHIGNEKLARILASAGAKKEAIEYAKTMTCDTCQRHKRVAPARAAAPPKDLTPNQVVGVDTVYLPGIKAGGKLKMALNIIDWSTRFQLVIPLEDHTPRAASRALFQWIRIFGPPERIYSDLGKEFRGCFQNMMDQESIVLDPGALETPTQRSITERAGKTFKEVLSKTLMEVTCTTWDEWHEAVDVTMATINRLANKSGFSPVQRMLGYSPRVPGTNLSGGFNDHATASRYLAGDLQVQRSVQLRQAAAIAYHKADCDQALRNALHAGHRQWHHYEVGQTVYYWKKGMQRAKKDNPSFWHGPAKVILTNLPNTVWVSHRGHIVKASPEHLRPAVDEEKFVLTDWIQDLVETKKRLQDQDFKGYIVLDETPPDHEDYAEDEEYIPPPRPKFRLTGKHAEADVEFKPDMFDEKRDEKRRRLAEPAEMNSKMAEPSLIEPVLPEGGIFNDPEDAPEIDSPDVVPTSPLPDEETDIEAEPTQDGHAEHAEELHRGQVRQAEGPDEGEPPAKRHRAEFLEILYNELEKITMTRNRKEITYGRLDHNNKKKFDKAISKEIQNNLKSGAYEVLSREESEKIRREKGHLIMKSRYVLVEKAVEPHEIEVIRGEGLLLDDETGEMLKAKARHVMKGYSEANAENLESTTPQVAKDSVIFTLQMLASHQWRIGHLDFTQAFHSGDQIERELYCSLPPEGIPGLHPRQILRLRKTCYGLTDGPYAWYRHLSKVLESRGYQKSRADPCLFQLFDKEHQKLTGVIALATDDMLHGGEEEHWKNMEWLRSQYKMGKFTTGDGKFTGKHIEQRPNGAILLHQRSYIEDKVNLIPIDRKRKRQRYSKCNASEINQLRALLGALAWVAKETRPDVAGRVALLQQSMPQPMIRDIVEANSVATELKQAPGLGILIQPIPMERLRVGVVTDASWGNAGGNYLEDNSKDYWEETEISWIRHHVLPRRLLFHPGAAPHGPDLHRISRKRSTVCNETEIEDSWDDKDSIRERSEEPWTGTTTFLKSEIEEETNKPINERFLQLARKHSQGGYLLIYYDEKLETTDDMANITIASWKSYKLKRCTVNTLSAECQSMLQGIGNLHWHRFLLAEVLAKDLSLENWERQLGHMPFIAVTDSRSLYDTITKCRNTSAHIDDKRTAIDLTILKGDLETTGGQVRISGRAFRLH